MYLKPQDTLLALKYWSLEQSYSGTSVRDIASSIGISAGEVSKGTKRLVAAKLLNNRDGRVAPEAGALLEWLSYGVRYAYCQSSIGYGRGMATSWNCPILNSEMVSPTPALVWPMPGGDVEGAWIMPFHKSVPFAASSDHQLYRALSLLEAIRGGKPRELKIARKLLAILINGSYE